MKFIKHIKLCRFQVLLAILISLLAFGGCEDENEPVLQEDSELVWQEDADVSGNQEEPGGKAANSSSGESWAIYWYICGSDLETRWGSATNDIFELQGVELPDNVQVVIQTGGAESWKNDMVDASALCRYERIPEWGFNSVGEEPLASMGSVSTLTDFLYFCAENYPADNVGLIFWNHGAGSGGGLCYDELFDDDYLRLGDLQTAFEEVYGSSEGENPFEFIGFDTCLMASVDTAAACAPWADYMIASEETEPGCGWKYDGWLSALAENPEMDGAELGRVICDTYYQGCEEEGSEQGVTLSVIDLAKADAVINAVDALGREGISAALEGSASTFFADYGRGASKSEYYSDGKCEMVDLVSLVSQNEHLFPETAAAIKKSVADCVVYQVAGSYRSDSNGLSVYYPYAMNQEQYQTFEDTNPAPGISYLYEMLFTGELSDNAWEYLDEADDFSDTLMYEEIDFADTSTFGLEDYPVEIVDIDGASYAQLVIGSDAADTLERVTFMLASHLDDGETVVLGEEFDLETDWENGVFTDNFRGVWGSIDGHLVMMEVISVTEDYILYAIPILIDDEVYSLTVAYRFDNQEYEILTATPDNVESDIPVKEQRLLSPGDNITTLFYFFGADDEGIYEYETFEFTADSAFYEVDLDDGQYSLLFVMTDYKSETYMSDLVSVTIEDGYIEIGDAG